MIYRGFASKLHHEVPDWVEPGTLFHIRIRLDRNVQQAALIHPSLGAQLLDSVRFYESCGRWYTILFRLMPDHLHAVLSFGRDERISTVLGDWKHFHKHTNHVHWLEGLCQNADIWPWVINPHRGQVDRPLRRAMPAQFAQRRTL
ncbi:MAG TPA: hypothetical protein VGM62_01910 [Chthoniobacterales bacterium]